MVRGFVGSWVCGLKLVMEGFELQEMKKKKRRRGEKRREEELQLILGLEIGCEEKRRELGKNEIVCMKSRGG